MLDSPDRAELINEVKGLSDKEAETLHIFVTGLLAGRLVKDYAPSPVEKPPRKETALNYSGSTQVGIDIS